MIDATNSPIERIRVLTSDIFSEEAVVDDHRGGPGVDVHTLLDAPDIIHLLDHFIHTSLDNMSNVSDLDVSVSSLVLVLLKHDADLIDKVRVNVVFTHFEGRSLLSRSKRQTPLDVVKTSLFH